MQVEASFLLIASLLFKVRSLFVYIYCSRIIGGNLFSLMARRTLAFCRRYGGMIYWSKWVEVFEGEDIVKKGKGKECFVSVT